MSKAKAKKSNWTSQMKADVLECKRKALELVSSDNAPHCNSGRKKGYIEIMRELWEGKGYGHLGLKGQNLRDQAARLERNQADASVDISGINSQTGDLEEPDCVPLNTI